MAKIMNASSLRLSGLFGAVSLLVVGAAGCRIEAHTQTQFEDSSQPAITAKKDWNGEKITIDNGGVNPVTGTTGVEVKVDPNAKRISVSATFAAHADDNMESDARASIKDAQQSLVIDEANGFTIHCGHGGAHGTSNVAGSGCKLLTITIPAGSATQPLDLTVGNGNGSMRVGLANAGDVPFVRNLTVDNNGSGDVDVRARAVKDAVIVITGEDKVHVALPSDFSAGKISLGVNETDSAKGAARIITDFPGFVNGQAYPANGATANAATSLSIQSKGILSVDTVTLNKF